MRVRASTRARARLRASDGERPPPALYLMQFFNKILPPCNGAGRFGEVLDMGNGSDNTLLALLRQLEMRQKRQAETLRDTEAQIAALRKQLGLK